MLIHYTCITQFAFPSYQLLLLNLIWMLIGYDELEKNKIMGNISNFTIFLGWIST